MTLSVILIVRNEAINLHDCLAGVALADEIVVVDYGSQDNTREIAIGLGARLITTLDWPGFGLQKNRALDAASSEWVLAIDADERVTPALWAQIQDAINSGKADAYEIPRLTQFCGQWIYHCGWTPDRVLRLFRRGFAHFSNDLVHEKLVLRRTDLPIKRLGEPLLHYSYPSPQAYWQKLQRYSHDWAAQKHAAGQKTSIARAALSGVTAFVRSYFFRLGFLDGSMGFVVCALQAQAAFGKYFELYWLGQSNED